MTRIIVVISAVASVLLLSMIYAQMGPAEAVAGQSDPSAPVSSAAPDHGDHGAPSAPDTTVEKDPNAPAYELRDATAPELAQGEVHDIDLYVVEQPMTVA